MEDRPTAVRSDPVEVGGGRPARPPTERSRRSGKRMKRVLLLVAGVLAIALVAGVAWFEPYKLLTNKTVTASIPSGTGSGIAKEISVAEKKYQEELNRGFTSLSEGAFKGLRRQLPVTRQKIEWDKVASYRLGQDIGGGSSRR